MPGVFYDPKVFAWGDAIGEGINAYLAGKDIQLKDLQRKKLYEDLAKEAEIKKGLTGITANQAAGRYAPTVSTTRGRQLTQESPTYDPMGLSSGAVALPTETVQQTTTVPPQRSMLTDLKNMYMKTGNIEKAVQIGQMEKIENELNTSKYTKLWELLDHTGTAAKNLNLEPESLIRVIIAPMLKNSGDPMLSNLDFSKVTIKKTEDMDTVIKNIYGKNGRELPLDFKVKFKADGTHEIQIEPKTETEPKTESEMLKAAHPIAEGETKADWNARILKLYSELKQDEKTLTPGQEAQKIRIAKESRAPEKPEYSPKQALARISTIDSTIARMKSSGMIDTAMAIQNPMLAALVDTKDPEAVNQAIASLENEREYVSQFAPKGTVKPKTPTVTGKEIEVKIPEGATTGAYKGKRAYKLKGKYFSIETGKEIK